MPKTAYIGHYKGQAFQTAIADEANTDAGATWGAAESTLANSLKVKVNAILVALRAARMLGGSGKVSFLLAIKRRILLTDVSSVAVADSDATYGQPEADLLNAMKAAVNSSLTAMRSARILTGRSRIRFLAGRKGQVFQTDIAAISIADADATYTSGGAGEQGLINDIKTKVNLILAALRATKYIA